MAAGLVTMQHARGNVLRRTPRLEVIIDNAPTELALIDVVVSAIPFLGSRAIWNMSQGREVVLARTVPATIGFSALGAALLDAVADEKAGAGIHIVLGAGDHEVLSPIASGHFGFSERKGREAMNILIEKNVMVPMRDGVIQSG